VIVASLTAELQRARQNSGVSGMPFPDLFSLLFFNRPLPFHRRLLQPAQKRMWDDAEKRLVVMSDMLNNHELSSGVTDRMIALAQGKDGHKLGS
jgi:hypothetical protein